MSIWPDKGLGLSELFYWEAAAPQIRERYPAHEGRIAAGLVGEGSICFGYDDLISRDHDWGAGFCLWLGAEDYEEIGEELQDLYEALPEVFQGYPTLTNSHSPHRRVGVFEIGQFYQRLIGQDRWPFSFAAWLAIPDYSLSAAVNGRVFSDLRGEFSAFREYLQRGYPEDVRLKKMARCALTAGQAGQYNYQRCLKRGDTVAALLAKTDFIRAVALLVYHLNRRYPPFYKWLHRGLQDLPILGDAAFRSLKALSEEAPGSSPRRRWLEDTARIEEVCTGLIRKLRDQGLTNSGSDFLVDHCGEINERIEDREIRMLPVEVM